MVEVRDKKGKFIKGHAPIPGCENSGEFAGRPRIHTEEFVDKECEALLEWMQKKENMFIEIFCYERGYDDSRVAIWKDRYPRFAATYTLFKTRQKGYLQQGALNKKYNYNAAALILGHNHGMYAKTEQKITGSPLEPLECIINAASGKTKDLSVKENENE